MNDLEKLYNKETGKYPRENFQPTLEYVEWLENKIESVIYTGNNLLTKYNDELNYAVEKILSKIGDPS